MRGKRRGKAETAWRDRLARFRGSGLTIREFCAMEHVSLPSFYQWRKRLDGKTTATKRTGPSGSAPDNPGNRGPFVPVHLTTAATVEIETPGGLRIRVPATNVEAVCAAILASATTCQEVPPC